MSNKFTAKELELVKTLLRLGDSKELAENTVISNRVIRCSNPEVYRFAYEN